MARLALLFRPVSPFSLVISFLSMWMVAPAFAQAETTPGSSTGTLHVVLFGPDGTMLVGAELRIAGTVATLGAEGGALVQLPAGTHELEVQPVAQAGVLPAPVRIPGVVVVAGEETELIAKLSAEGRFEGIDLTVPKAEAVEEKVVASAGPVARGRIVGLVVSVEDDSPLEGAKVFVRGEPVEATTGSEGRFSLDVPVGNHTISVIRSQFSSQTVGDLVVPADGEREVKVELTPASLTLDDYVITAPHVEGGVAAVFAERRETTAVAEVIGAEQMSKAGDSSAASALRRVTGLTLVGGKFIYIRGMGDRYGTTLMNGLRVPSPEPDVRVVPLDLFPAGLLESVLVQKTYSPDMPGDFGGGVVSMRSKGYPENLTISGSVGVGGNSRTTFRTVRSYKAGAYDWLGTDDGDRTLPSAVTDVPGPIKATRSPRSPTGYTRDEVNAIGREFSNRWKSTNRFLLPDGDMSLVIGNRFDPAPNLQWGFAAAALYSHEWSYVPNEQRTQATLEGDINRKSKIDSLERQVFAGGMLTTGLTYVKDQKLNFVTMLLRQTTDESAFIDGEAVEFGGEFRQARYRFVERQLFSQQVHGEQVVHGLSDLKIDWKYAFSLAARDEPDRIDYLYTRQPGVEQFALRTTSGSNERFFSGLDDTVHDARLDLVLPVELWSTLEGKIKAGGATFWQQRSVDTRRFIFDANGADPELLRLPPEQVLSPSNIGVPGGLNFDERSRISDPYEGDVEILAGYGAVDIPIVKSLDVSGGVRVEAAKIKATTVETEGKVDSLDVLPSVNATYRFTDAIQLRGGFAMTVNRPDLRELVPSQFDDVQTGVTKQGNPELQPATLQHYDARIEWYVSGDESVSLGGFYKSFDEPIEQKLYSGATPIQTWDNADGGYNTGLEVEGRKLLDFVHERLENVYVSANFAYIKSSVDLKPGGTETSKKRPLAGQSPWILNLQLGYDADGLNASILYNVAGERIDSVGVMGLADVLEQPFHQLDFVISKELGQGFRLSGKAKNLLNSQRKMMQGPVIFQSYRPGIDASLDLTFNL